MECWYGDSRGVVSVIVVSVFTSRSQGKEK